jgi:DNA-nicking Smr family endonuclease
MTGKRAHPNEDGRALWQSVTADITPLEGRVAPPPAPPPPAPREEPPEPPLPTAPLVKPRRALPPLEAGRTPGIDRRTAERLRRGQLAIDYRLDLHGMTREEAYEQLGTSIATSWEAGRRVILVITGKGQGILRDAVPRWLNEGSNRRRIIAFCVAQPKHGGGGALYVLLKRRR